MHTRMIYLLRHGQPEDHVPDEAVFRGRTNSPLSKQGFEQMQQAVRKLEFQKIISSPLQRCAEFAEALARQKKLPLEEDLNLMEIDFGKWDGQAVNAIARHWAVELQAFWNNPLDNTPPDGEPLGAFQERVIKFWNRLLSREPELDSLLVIHGGVQKIILAHILQMPLGAIHNIEVPYACCSVLNVYYNDDEIKATLKQHGQPL